MTASEKPIRSPRCGKWMPRKKDNCARTRNHKGDCRTADALKDNRERLSDRRRGTRRGDDPEARRRWARVHKFVRLGITEAQFLKMLEAQDYACAICQQPFEDGKRICADHDHTCCPMVPDRITKTCGKCIRGLLCVRCNTRVEWFVKYAEQVQAYLARAAVVRAGLEPATPEV